MYRFLQTASNPWLGDHIQYSPPGVHTIIPMTPLPTIIASNTTIDGTTQPGFTGTPLIVIDGSSIPSVFTNPIGLDIQSNGCTVKSLVINNFNSLGFGVGIQLENTSTGNTIQGCFIGTDFLGTTALGNNRGIQVFNSDNTIESNLISGNGAFGISISTNSPIDNIKIQGNLIGVNITGKAPLPNGFGIGMEANFSGSIEAMIGGSAGTGNVISANNNAGISMQGGVTNSIIQGNFIGTDTTGNLDLGNGTFGIEMLTNPFSASPNTNNLI